MIARRALLALTLTTVLAPPVGGGDSNLKPSSADTVVRAASPEVRKEKLANILSRREFAASRMSWVDQIVERARRLASRAAGAISRALDRAFGWVFGEGWGAAGVSKTLSQVLSVVVIILFLLLLAYVLARLGGARVVGSVSEGPDDFYAGPGSPRAALDDAAPLAAAGDFRSALRLVYLAALLELDERELIRFDRTGTNWEYLAALRSRPDIDATLRPVTMLFDRKWYGHEPAAESDYVRFLDAYRAIESVEVGR